VTDPDARSPEHPTLVRRLSWRPVARGIAGLGFLGVLMAGFGAVGVLSGDSLFSVMWVLAVLCLASAGGLAFLNARARTRIAPEGVVNRAVWSETTIPWHDVAEIVVQRANSQRTVQIRRHGGGVVTLAALRDHPAAPDPRFDATVAVIRHRAEAAAGPAAEGASGAAGAARREGAAALPDGGGSHGALEPYPMTLRPSRRPLLLVLPLAVAATAGAVQLFEPTRSLLLFVPIAVLLVLWRYVLIMLVGWTAVDDQGITNRGPLLRRHTPWRDVDSLSVTNTLFGRMVLLSVEGRRPSALAAPRQGLLARTHEGEDPFARLAALARPHGVGFHSGPSRGTVWAGLAVVLLVVAALSLPFDQPWKRPWWPWLHEASEISEPCALAEAPVPTGEPPAEASTERYGHQEWTCEWEAEPGAWGSLRVEYVLHEYRSRSSGTDHAREDYARSHEALSRGADAHDPVALGEEAVRAVVDATGDNRVFRVTHLVRTANVVVQTSYTAEDPAEEVQADAEAIAREALDRVDVD
jgi:hypothetical protein